MDRTLAASVASVMEMEMGEQVIHSLLSRKPRWIRRRVWRWQAWRYYQQGWRYSHEPAGLLTRVMVWDVVNAVDF